MPLHGTVARRELHASYEEWANVVVLELPPRVLVDDHDGLLLKNDGPPRDAAGREDAEPRARRRADANRPRWMYAGGERRVLRGRPAWAGTVAATTAFLDIGLPSAAAHKQSKCTVNLHNKK